MSDIGDGPFVDEFCDSCDQWTRVRGGEALCHNCLALVRKTRRELAREILWHYMRDGEPKFKVLTGEPTGFYAKLREIAEVE